MPARRTKQSRHPQSQPRANQRRRSAPNERWKSSPTQPTGEVSEAARYSGPPVAFGDLALPQPLVDALARNGIHSAFPIQAATLDDALAGRDVLGRAGTGSGKTLAFGLPMLTRTAGERAAPRRPLGLVLTPTRELAQQVRDALLPYAKTLGPRLATVVGGAPIQRQIEDLRRGTEVLVATPGRLSDLVRRGACELDGVRISVLDEADQMADMGFLPEVSALLDQVESDGQRLLFSATLDGEVDTLVARYLTEPATHTVDPPTATIATMTHHVLRVGLADKQAVTASIAARHGRTLMFVRTKERADQLTEELLQEGVRASALHGGKAQRTRTRTLERFRDGRLNVLIATDVAARGIHVEGIDLVINVDPPQSSKDYLHRGGRTARAGESGAVATLVLPRQRRTIDRMMAAAGIEPEAVTVRPGGADLVRITGARTPSGVPVPAEPAPAPSGSGRARGRGRPQNGRRPKPPTSDRHKHGSQRDGPRRERGNRNAA